MGSVVGKSIFLFLICIFSASSVFGTEFFVSMNGDFKATKLNLPDGVELQKTLSHLELYIVVAEEKPVIENSKFVILKKVIQIGKWHSVEGMPVDITPFRTQDYTWGLEYIEAPLVWSRGFKGQGVKVLVLDTGIDLDQPVFKNQNIVSKDFTNTKINLGVDYPEYDSAGHGTHVAGTILGEGVGVAPEAELYAAKVCVFDCTNYRDAVVEGLDWGLEKGIRVVNMSISLSHFSPQLGDHIFNKLEELEVVVTSSSGNHKDEKNNAVSFPGTQSTVLTVGAVDQEGAVAHFSNTGPSLDVLAPGVDVLSADLVRTRESNPSLLTLKSGTSMASPHVAGLAALLLSADLSLTAAEVRSIIKGSSIAAVGADEEVYGKGVINAHSAFNMLRQIKPVLY